MKGKVEREEEIKQREGRRKRKRGNEGGMKERERNRKNGKKMK
jgi:hypothetical protein